MCDVVGNSVTTGDGKESVVFLKPAKRVLYF